MPVSRIQRDHALWVSSSYVLIANSNSVTSWGESCGQEDSVGVYAKVSSQIDWINDVIEGIYTTEAKTDTTTWDTLGTTEVWTSESWTTTEDYRTVTEGTTTTVRPDNALPLGLMCDGNRWFNTSIEEVRSDLEIEKIYVFAPATKNSRRRICYRQ